MSTTGKWTQRGSTITLHGVDPHRRAVTGAVPAARALGAAKPRRSPYGPTAQLPPSRGSSSVDASPLRANVARIASEEWQRWAEGTIQESDPRVRARLEEYWQTGVGALPAVASFWSAVPWSAAFISWVMRSAGAGAAFKYSGRHTDYVGAAKQNALAKNDNPFKAYPQTAVAARVGDLVCLARNSSGVTYDNVDKGSYDSHCDIVTEIGSGRLVAIGGNVRQSVASSTRAIDARGFVTATECYAILRIGE